MIIQIVEMHIVKFREPVQEQELLGIAVPIPSIRAHMDVINVITLVEHQLVVVTSITEVPQRVVVKLGVVGVIGVMHLLVRHLLPIQMEGNVELFIIKRSRQKPTFSLKKNICYLLCFLV